MRIKLTEDGIEPIWRLHGECTYRDSKFVLVVDGGETEEEAQQLKQQILDDQEKLEKIKEEIFPNGLNETSKLYSGHSPNCGDCYTCKQELKLKEILGDKPEHIGGVTF